MPLSISRDRSHAKRAIAFATSLMDQDIGFLMAWENSTPGCTYSWSSLENLLSLPLVSYLPLYVCKHGLISDIQYSDESGIVSNVPELVQSFREASESVVRRHGSTLTEPDLERQGLLSDVVNHLRKDGWIQNQAQETVSKALMTEVVHTGVPNNVGRVAHSIVDWLKSEDLCDIDYANHAFLTEHFPTDKMSTDSATVTPWELVTPAAGEDIDEEFDPSSDEGSNSSSMSSPAAGVTNSAGVTVAESVGTLTVGKCSVRKAWLA